MRPSWGRSGSRSLPGRLCCCGERAGAFFGCEVEGITDAVEEANRWGLLPAFDVGDRALRSRHLVGELNLGPALATSP